MIDHDWPMKQHGGPPKKSVKLPEGKSHYTNAITSPICWWLNHHSKLCFRSHVIHYQRGNPIKSSHLIPLNCQKVWGKSPFTYVKSYENIEQSPFVEAKSHGNRRCSSLQHGCPGSPWHCWTPWVPPPAGWPATRSSLAIEPPGRGWEPSQWALKLSPEVFFGYKLGYILDINGFSPYPLNGNKCVYIYIYVYVCVCGLCKLGYKHYAK